MFYLCTNLYRDFVDFRDIRFVYITANGILWKNDVTKFVIVNYYNEFIY